MQQVLYYTYPILGLVKVIDLSQGNNLRGTIMAKFTEDDAISQGLLKLRGERQLLFNACLHPPEYKTRNKQKQIVSSLQERYVTM